MRQTVVEVKLRKKLKSLPSFSISIVSLSTELATFPESSIPRVKNRDPTRPLASREITPKNYNYIYNRS